LPAAMIAIAMRADLGLDWVAFGLVFGDFAMLSQYTANAGCSYKEFICGSAAELALAP
jgi:hypothetical protein